MTGKIKGIHKGFKSLVQIFVVKEREMEIGHPTDVIHVAHIGVDHSSAVNPSWMNEFKIGPNKTVKPINTRVSQPTALSTWSPQDVDQSMGSHPATEMTRNRSCTDLPNLNKKRKCRKKSASMSESSCKGISY
ncbi:CRIB domain-containing protein RIC10 [Hibiscus syriacus]|uniref:CRIB domain-containing protein RIC10 n=1 Tax=Hibiscus syriacus TaxID=106335 RepID=A0A6A3CJE2_HIBSY|nr:CRIB domain-containing protein RIC10-like [Hibiscus syriacus]KAE8728817.1 CRIB domain-containing protein RIC10 [Hibiscus syriacus]